MSNENIRNELLRSITMHLKTAETNANEIFGGPTEIECHVLFADGRTFFWNGKEFEEQE